MASSLSATIFRRGGPKKESAQNPHQLLGAAGTEHDGSDVDDNDAGEQQQLVSAQELLAIISTPRSGKEYSAAIWRPHACGAELVKARKGTAQANGRAVPP